MADDRKRVRRVGVIGDVHAEDELLEVALGSLASRDLDAILAVGDVVDGLGDATRCCRLLRDAGAITVRGNHERWLLTGTCRDLPDATEVSDEARVWLASLPQTVELDTPSGRAMLCHAVGDDDMADIKPESKGYDLQIAAFRELVAREDLSFMIGGHTHRRMVRRFPGLTIVNVGTLHRDLDPCYCVVDFESRRVQYWEIDRDKARAGGQHELPFPGEIPAGTSPRS